MIITYRVAGLNNCMAFCVPLDRLIWTPANLLSWLALTAKLQSNLYFQVSFFGDLNSGMTGDTFNPNTANPHMRQPAEFVPELDGGSDKFLLVQYSRVFIEKGNILYQADIKYTCLCNNKTSRN